MQAGPRLLEIGDFNAMKRLSSVVLAAFTAMVAMSSAVHAADTYPTRTTAIYVPYSPGGITDVLARIVAQELGEQMDKTYIVENKPGGGTVVAVMTMLNAMPDGYTLMVAPNGTLAINPTLRKSLPFKLSDVKPIALIGWLPFALVASNDFPAKTVKDLIDLAKKKPGEINYGSGGFGTNGAIFMSLMESLTGIKMLHVPFSGSAPQLTATIANQVQVGFVDINSAAGLAKGGKLRVLAVTSTERSSVMPDVPTMEEAGVKGYDAVSWQMLIAPAGTPKAVADLLNEKVNAIIQKPDVKAKIEKLGVTPGGKRDIAELDKFLHAEETIWSDVIKKAGLAGSI